jgi:hypothetical protein
MVSLWLPRLLGAIVAVPVERREGSRLRVVTERCEIETCTTTFQPRTPMLLDSLQRLGCRFRRDKPRLDAAGRVAIPRLRQNATRATLRAWISSGTIRCPRFVVTGE